MKMKTAKVIFTEGKWQTGPICRGLHYFYQQNTHQLYSPCALYVLTPSRDQFRDNANGTSQLITRNYSR